jgi:uncharacterized membrane protein YhaH (DUF805 family)
MNSLIDILFSLKGRIGRTTWWVASLALLVAAVSGVALFNEDNFDESAHAISEAPTMAAFLWVAICVYVGFALTVKRFADAARTGWLGAAFAVAAAALVIGWGLGAFHHPFATTTEAAVFWLLALPVALALFEAGSRPSAVIGTPAQ